MYSFLTNNSGSPREGEKGKQTDCENSNWGKNIQFNFAESNDVTIINQQEIRNENKQISSVSSDQMTGWLSISFTIIDLLIFFYKISDFSDSNQIITTNRQITNIGGKQNAANFTDQTNKKGY